MSTPLVPARPTRANGGSASKDSTPQVPPRPSRKTDPSPSRDFRSPLNELPNPIGYVPPQPSNLSVEEVPPRPPSVSLPSIGQEGSEYASYDLLPPIIPGVNNVASAEFGTPGHTSNVAKEMPLHAPKASLPQSTAKSRIETVTKTNSTQAAAAGIGEARPDDDVHNTPADSSLSLAPTETNDDLSRVPSATARQKASFSRPTSGTPTGYSRPQSVYDEFHEQGIPEIGKQIPLNPNAGDAQAPSPAQAQSQYTPGLGFFNDGSARAHQRKRSARQEFGPPGSYGLHSHGEQPHDRFERDWYARHPEQTAIEGFNMYGRPRPETALSSAELNRIVSARDDVGMGANAAMVSTPSEDIAFSASDAYASRISPKPSPVPISERTKRRSSGSQPVVESPLRRASYPFPRAGQAVDEESDDTIHVDPAEIQSSKITGGGLANGAVDLGPHGGNSAEEGGWIIERGDGTPILASDEVLKRRESSMMQPAVNPEYHHDDDDYYDSSRRNSLRVPSRPSSRPGSMHGYEGGNLHRFISHEEPHHGSGLHTPLEEIEEYEPLIPEGEEEESKPKPKEIARRPGLAQHHFPSQDIWEDTPSSMYYHTTVETPEPSAEEQTTAPPSKTLETPNGEQQRNTADPNDFSGERTMPKPHYASRLAGDRPGVQRFPSKDIWEDTPSSMYYSTTVNSPQMDESMSPPDDRPTTSALPGSQDDSEARATTGFALKPQIPARPQRSSKLAQEMKPEGQEQQDDESRDLVEEKSPPSPEKAKAPPIPDRPKPTVPARPARSSRSENTDETGRDLTTTTSAESVTSNDGAAAPPPVKTKPVVPARPAGEKIAALKSGFMNDLNNRLKIGPKAPPPQSREIEPEANDETQKAPLPDARKGRAKGPARRKPAASPSSEAVEEKAASLSFSTTSTIWSIHPQDDLQVPSTSAAPQAAETETETGAPALEKLMTENTTANTVEPTLVESNTVEKVFSPPPLEEVKMMSPEETKSLQAELETSLANVGAAPAPETTVADVGDIGEGEKMVAPTESAKEVAANTSAEQAVEEDATVKEAAPEA